MYCWASALGGCDTTSREHLISEGMWDEPAIYVVGFEWCKTQPLEVGLAGVNAKILCRKHNSQLSPVDQGGINAFRAIKAQAREIDERLMQSTAGWDIRTIRVSGALVERWLLKTLINIALRKGPNSVWPGGSNGVPVELVDAAFGVQPLRRPLGLYVPASKGDRVDLQDRIEIATLLSDKGSLVGAEFSFAGLKMVLAISNDIPDRIVSQEVSALYRISRLNHKIAGRPSHILEFEW
jgi:hypothetical protein